MSRASVLRYRVARWLGRFTTRLAALLTLGEMPPFVSTSALIVDGQRLLVVVDAIRGEPVLPGGHLKWAEKPASALVREVREETGFVVAPHALVGVFAGKQWAGEAGVVRVVFEASVTGGAIASSSEGEATWMSLGDFVASDTRDAPVVRGWLEGRAAWWD
ncbi:MAG: NUDIX domain-containing protein [Chloroflexi bacterium]|nr:NUDIX domain-containing protein [Chloroflexota bacterium]